jgi:hypothetical protein
MINNYRGMRWHLWGPADAQCRPDG